MVSVSNSPTLFVFWVGRNLEVRCFRTMTKDEFTGKFLSGYTYEQYVRNGDSVADIVEFDDAFLALDFLEEHCLESDDMYSAYRSEIVGALLGRPEW